MEDCLFCKIVRGELGSDVVLDRDGVLAFRDVNPQAPVHILVVPKEHIADLPAAAGGRSGLLGEMLETVVELAEREGVAGDGYRVVANVGPAAGQSVAHLHFHLLGGRAMTWPPG